MTAGTLPCAWPWTAAVPGAARCAEFTTALDALDAVAAQLAQLVAQGALPHLQLVTFAGFSAGGQLLQRYAFARTGGGQQGPLQLRFIVSDPGSWLYLHPQRPAANCTPLRDTGTGWACRSFGVPAAAGCADYDAWKYGVSGGLDDNLYILPLASDPAAVAALVADYPKRDVRYLFGSLDACNCNTQGYANQAWCAPQQAAGGCLPNAYGPPGCCDTYPDSITENVLDVGCEAMLQGSNRLQRGLLFASYLQAAYPGFSPLFATFTGGHNASAFFGSATFGTWAYAD